VNPNSEKYKDGYTDGVCGLTPAQWTCEDPPPSPALDEYWIGYSAGCRQREKERISEVVRQYSRSSRTLNSIIP